jgi:hypothetical protein
MRKEDYLSMAGYPNTPEGEAAFYREYDTPEKFQMKFGGTTAFPQARTEAEFYNFGAPMQFSTVTMKNGGSPYYAAPTAAQMFSYGVPAPNMMMFMKGGQPCFECGGGLRKRQDGGQSQQDMIAQVLAIYAESINSSVEDVIAQLQQLSPEEQEQALMQIIEEVRPIMEAQSSSPQTEAPMDQQMMEQEMQAQQMQPQQMGEMQEEGMPMAQDGGMAGYSEGPDSYLGKTTNFINYLRSTAAMANLKETYPFLMKNGGMKKMADGGNTNELNFDPFSNWESFQDAYEASETEPGFREGLSAFFGGRFDNMRSDQFTPFSQYLKNQEELEKEDEALEQAQVGKAVQPGTPEYNKAYDIVANTIDRETRLGYDNYGFTQDPEKSYSPYTGGRDEAIKDAIDKYYNKYGLYELPLSQQAMGFDFAFNSEDPRASMMVAAGKLTPAEKVAMYKSGKLDPTAVDAAWQKYGKDVMAMGDALGDPFAAEKIRSYTNTSGVTPSKLAEWTNRVNETKDYAKKYYSSNAGSATTSNLPTGVNVAGPSGGTDSKANTGTDGKTSGLEKGDIRVIDGKYKRWDGTTWVDVSSKTNVQTSPRPTGGLFDLLPINWQPYSNVKLKGNFPGGFTGFAGPLNQIVVNELKTRNPIFWGSPSLKRFKGILNFGPGTATSNTANTTNTSNTTTSNLTNTNTTPSTATNTAANNYNTPAPTMDNTTGQGEGQPGTKLYDMTYRRYGGMPKYADGSGFNKTFKFKNLLNNSVEADIKEGLRPTNQSIADLSLMGVNMLTGIGKDLEANKRKQDFRKKMQDPTSLFMQNYDTNRGDYSTNWNSFRPNELVYTGPYAQQGGVFVNGMTQFLTSPVIRKIKNIGGNTYE